MIKRNQEKIYQVREQKNVKSDLEKEIEKAGSIAKGWEEKGSLKS